jgi:hypothetical protein
MFAVAIALIGPSPRPVKAPEKPGVTLSSVSRALFSAAESASNLVAKVGIKVSD